MSEEVRAALIGVAVGSALTGLFSYLIGKYSIIASHRNAVELMQRQEYIRAASKFKTFIIYELTGLYPIEQYWEEIGFNRLYNSLPRVLSAAEEFRLYVTCKDDFDAAIKKYDEYCRLTKFVEIIPPDKFPSMSYIDKRQQFKHIVEHLISFADEILNKTK